MARDMECGYMASGSSPGSFENLLGTFVTHFYLALPMNAKGECLQNSSSWLRFAVGAV